MIDLLARAHGFPAGLLVNAAMLLQATGLALGGPVALRVRMLAGTGFHVAHDAVVADAPLWDAIAASLVIGSANVVGLLRDRRRPRP